VAQLEVSLLPAPAAVPCSLFVHVTPHADRVLIDSVAASGGPEVFASALAAGKHKVTAQAAGFLANTQKIAVPKGAGRQTIYVVMQPDPSQPPGPDGKSTGGVSPEPGGGSAAPAQGTISMNVSVKPASDVLLDEVKVATHVTSATLMLTEGKHTVRVVNPDFATVSKTFEVDRKHKVRPLEVDLTSGTRGLFVSGPRSNLQIFLDGHFTGKTTPDQVLASAGAHEVSVRDANGGAVLGSMRVIVDPSKLGNMNVTFKP
jgi:hypothetical protein